MTTNTDTPDSLRAAADSFDRCDTDGFLSQWASGMTARKQRAQADLLEAGGMIEMSALFNLDGTVASTHRAYGEYGAYWVLNDTASMRFGKRFFRPSKAQKAAIRRKNNAAKGFAEGIIRVAGYVDIVGSGTGLAGCASAYVATLPSVDALKAGDYEIVSTDSDADDQDDIARMTPSEPTPAAEAAITPRSTGSHATCDHPATKSERAKCRKARQG
jgi:hypothetical protein